MKFHAYINGRIIALNNEGERNAAINILSLLCTEREFKDYPMCARDFFTMSNGDIAEVCTVY